MACNFNLTGLNAFAREAHETAAAHGFWDPEPSFGEIIALCHSELSEALEAYRNHMPPVCVEDKDANGNPIWTAETDPSKWGDRKPEGAAVEMADCIIRILDWCGANDIDMEAILTAKHRYNQSRTYRHGGKAL